MPSPLFASEFYESLISFETGSRFSFSEYFTSTYQRNYDFCDFLPCLLSRASVSVTSPFFYEAAGLNAFCLLHTKRGSGQLFYDDSILPPPHNLHRLLPDTLAFIDCHKRHKLICLHNVWEYTICFVSAPVSAYFYQKLKTFGDCIFSLSEDSDVRTFWKRFAAIEEDDELHGLMRSRELSALYTQLYLSRAIRQRGTYHIPPYLVQIRQCFDTAFQEQYSLDDLSARYSVNKFTLVRQFARYYQETPIQYLNQVRIEKAKDLLLHSNQKISAIGRAVGIENTNHFIRLFKEKTGVSPAVYRRDTPVLR